MAGINPDSSLTFKPMSGQALLSQHMKCIWTIVFFKLSISYKDFSSSFWTNTLVSKLTLLQSVIHKSPKAIFFNWNDNFVSLQDYQDSPLARGSGREHAQAHAISLLCESTPNAPLEPHLLLHHFLSPKLEWCLSYCFLISSALFNLCAFSPVTLSTLTGSLAYFGLANVLFIFSFSEKHDICFLTYIF